VALARACLAAWQTRGSQAIGLVLDHHGALAVGGTADEAHMNTLAIRERADAWLAARGAPRWRRPSTVPPLTFEQALAVARLRGEASRIAGRRLAGCVRDGGDFGAFIRRPGFRRAASHGPSTPGHAIYTKRHPLIDGDMQGFAKTYRRELGDDAPVDGAPRVIIDERFGMLALGVSARHARITAEVFEHDAQIMARAEATGGYEGAGQAHLVAAEIEYAGFEARVARESRRAGEVHLLDGTQRDAAAPLMAAGAAVALLDATGDDSEANLLHLPSGLPAEEAVGRVVAHFGGIDHTSLSPDRLPGLARILDVTHA
jgi:rhamnose utilization protein RhaD (predicted bifunctional aldolase and dehydrogenase)